MNLWALISTIILSFSLTASPVYHLSTVNVNNDSSQATLNLEVKTEKKSQLPYKLDNNSLGVKIGASSAAVMDSETGLVLWQKNATEQRSIASITKLMSILVFLEHNPGWDQLITMEEKDETNGNSPNIYRGEIAKVSDLFRLALIASDNNAVMALMRSTGFSQAEFVSLMNKKALDLGLVNTIFVDPTGLNAGNKSTALEVLKLAQTAFASKEVTDVSSLSRYDLVTQGGRQERVYATNWLLHSYLDVEAGKTGYIEASGYCLVAKISGDDGQKILTVVLGSESNDHRFYDAKVLSAWVFDNFIWS
ncbi:D-alanyl-D-alanine carboxypeptidase [Candidatus Parcubacteria bacterium]|nr:MAG: D-alanyl-D-alanine carboxypeptidase [Candidatus Parcubacteria bacterium]